jgi:parallel beta-helix repeat protein
VGQDVKNDSRVCRTPPGPPKDLTLYLKPNPILVAVSLTLILMTSGLVYYLMLPPPYTPPPPPPPSSAVIAIDGDANFYDIALLKGWPGDGSPENPFIIDGLDIVVDGGNLISISNTRVSFTISNCNLTGACINSMYSGDGIHLENVTNGEIVNNICNKNEFGIFLTYSDFNTVANNICNNNRIGIELDNSDSNTVANNTCTSIDFGILLRSSISNALINNTVADNNCFNNIAAIFLTDCSDSNTVANNTCNGNFHGIYLSGSSSNNVVNNTSNSNEYGIFLRDSDFNTVTTNTCTNNNEIGIYLDDESEFNTVENNAFSGNTEHDIVDEWLAHQKFVAGESVWFLAGCGMILVVSVILVVQFRRVETHRESNIATKWKTQSPSE